MLTHITCDCGNIVRVTDDPADVENRCARCGRRVFTNYEDAVEYHSALGEPQQPPTPIGNKSRARSATQPPPETQRRSDSDPDATVLHFPSIPVASSENGNANSLTNASMLSPNSDDFEVAYQPPVDDDSGTIPGSGSSAGSSSLSSAKYDLSKRVMRAIARPVAPVVPYTGTGEYGIHRILRIHQRGGMGRILVAYDQYLKREVAIKELHPDVAEDESIVRRFIGEAEITAQLEHPGVVPIHRIGQGRDGLPYYTMKMINGATLQEAIKAYHRKPSKLELMNLVRRLVSVSKTIAFSHSKGVIHRDLKPANIMLGEHGETLVMDWGLAKPYNRGIEDTYISIVHQTKQSRPELTMVGAIVGTPAFMSPEQAMAEENMVGPLSDVFSLGTVLYYLLAGQTAFSGRSTQEVLAKVRACNPVPPSQIKSSVPHGLEAICLKAMAKLPENRYQGASEFADDLCRWLDDEPISAKKDPPWSKIFRWMLRNTMVSIGIPAVLVFSLLLSSIGVWLVVRNRDSTSAAAMIGNLGPIEFKKNIQVESPGNNVWRDHRYTGELLLVCKIKPMDSETEQVIRIHAPADAPWDLSARHSLTFSLLEDHGEKNIPLENPTVRLGAGTSYYEYKPSVKLWENRNWQNWVHFTIPMNGNKEDWTRDHVGEPTMEKVEWLEIHFETDSESTLIFDNLKFR